MSNSVIIKGNKYGIVVVLDEHTEFDVMKKELGEKFQSASKFFDKANMAISFEGRKLSPDEERELLSIISQNSDLNIVCVIDTDEMRESESSIIILGDVNPGAKVIAKGNVIILGSLRGNIYAGAGGNEDAFVVALEMAPIQIRIGEIIARSSDESSQRKALSGDAMIAYVDEGHIYIGKLDKENLTDIRL